MDNFRRYVGQQRQIIDYTRFMDLTGTKLFICLDQGIMEICRYLLNTRGSWRTTYAKEYGEVGYTMPTEEEFENVLNAIGEANIDMSSCTDIVEALNNIAATIEAGNTSSGGTASSGCGCIASGDTNVEDVADSPSETIPQPEDPLPPGFETEEDYDDYRCKAAHYVFDNYVQTLRNWATLSGILGGLTLAVVTGLLLLSVPPLGLTIIMAALGTLVGIDIGLLATLSQIADGLEESETDVICQIYLAENTEEAANYIRQAASDVIDSLSLGALDGTFTTITDNLISNAQMEVLFTLNADINSMEPQSCSCVGECSCPDGELYIWTDIGNQGTIVSSTPITNGIEYIIDSGSYQTATVDAFISPSGTPPEFCARSVTVEVLSGSIQNGNPVSWRFYDGSGGAIWVDTFPPEFPICSGGLSLRSDTSFQVKITIEDIV